MLLKWISKKVKSNLSIWTRIDYTLLSIFKKVIANARLLNVFGVVSDEFLKMAFNILEQLNDNLFNF